MQRPKKRSRDISEIAAFVVRATTEEIPEEKSTDNKNPNAVALGKLGGAKGGLVRASKLSTERKTEIARKAAETRWGKKKAN